MPSATAAGTLKPVETSVRIAGQGMSASVTCLGSVSTNGNKRADSLSSIRPLAVIKTTGTSSRCTG
jgi:hypothetical protein